MSRSDKPTMKAARIEGMTMAGKGVSPATAQWAARISYKDQGLYLSCLLAYHREARRLERKFPS
jgi:hypothetical protein